MCLSQALTADALSAPPIRAHAGFARAPINEEAACRAYRRRVVGSCVVFKRSRQGRSCVQQGTNGQRCSSRRWTPCPDVDQSDGGVDGPDRLGIAAHGLDVRAIGHHLDGTGTNGGECEAFHRSLLVRV